MQKSFEDIAVLYRSEEDGVWVAHSLRTDQLGTGDRMVDALADLIRAVDAVAEIAAADSTVQFFREAPEEIQKLKDSAKRLPGEVYDVAHKMARGEWPDDVEVSFDPKDEHDQFVTEIDCAPA